MKNKAIQLMIAKQHNVNEEDVTVEHIATTDSKYEFKVTVLNNSLSVANGHDYREVLQVVVETKPWVEDPFVM